MFLEQGESNPKGEFEGETVPLKAGWSALEEGETSPPPGLISQGARRGNLGFPSWGAPPSYSGRDGSFPLGDTMLLESG